MRVRFPLRKPRGNNRDSDEIMFKQGRRTAKLRALKALACVCGLLLALPATATKIDVRYVDEDGHGYKDTTPATPVEGNPGTTKGEQAQGAFEYVSSLVERMVWIPDEAALRIDAWQTPVRKTAPRQNSQTP